jgi:hypothetical protein
VHRRPLRSGPLTPCWNQAHVPHIEEATFFYLGDTRVAEGKPGVTPPRIGGNSTGCTTCHGR